MKYSQLFGKTVKSTASDMQTASHKFLFQAGFIRESTAGRYYLLPLGMRVHQKVARIIKQEMDKAGAQELITPVLHPLELWQETNRTQTAGFELMVIKDRRGASFALGGTAEEMMVDLVRKFQISYKDMPFNIYQFSTKFRDELRARGGLLRVREFVMKDAYSFHATEEDFRKEYQNMRETYLRIFKRLGLETAVVESDNGYIGGEYCHEFVVESEVGESRYLTTDDGNYAAHEDVAVFVKDQKNITDELKPLQEVEAVRGTTMEDGVKLHKLPLWQQIKDVLYKDEKGRFVLAIIRGDFDVNEVKLLHLAKATTLTMASEEEVHGLLHSEPGFISPVGIKEIIAQGHEVIIIADDSLRTVHNSYGGANKKHRDLFNINIDRDFKADVEGDIAMAEAGFLAKDGKQKLLAKKGIEVGNIFQLGYHYSHLMRDAVFMDADGKEKPYYMGCYGIGLGRTIATVVEKYHDDKGIIWPEQIAPFQVHLVSLGRAGEDSLAKAEEVYNNLLAQGIEVLWDDRDAAAGEKFNDADLIGIPVRLVVSSKSLAGGGVELKQRAETSSEIVAVADLLAKLKTLI